MTDMDISEIRPKVKYITSLEKAVPPGLSQLKMALTFACLDLMVYYYTRVLTKSAERALRFADSIPYFDDFDSDSCTQWMFYDYSYLLYLP